MVTTFSTNKYLMAFLATIIVFTVYLFTLAKGVIHLDSGELAAVTSTLGIAHPTGYPLFTMLGFIFTKIFFFLGPVMAVNLMAAICTSGAVFFIILIIYQLLNKVAESNSNIIIASLSGILFAFSKTFWFQSTSVEVYSLHLLLISATIYVYLLATESKEINFIKQPNWIVFAVLFALCFSNHLTSILVIPAFLYLFFNTYGFEKKSFLQALLLLIPFALVLVLVYSYIPIRASQNPVINWGNPIDYERFLRHIMGWQYQTWFFSSFASASKQFTYFVKNFSSEFGYLAALVFFPGLYFFFKASKKYFFFIVIMFLTCVFYSINYDISDIDAYFLLAYVAVGIVNAFVIQKLYADNKTMILIPLIIIMSVVVNFEKVNQSNNKQFEQYTRHFLTSLQPNAIVLGYTWDFLFSPAYYVQFVDNYRKDVIMIDKELLRRSWYYNQLKTSYPEFYKTIEKEVEAFLPELAKFERQEKNIDGNLLDKHYKGIINKIINANIDSRPIYICIEMLANEINSGDIKLSKGVTYTPDYFAYRLRKTNDYLPVELADFPIDYLNDTGYYTSQIRKFNSSLHIERAFYEYRFGKSDNAKFFKNKALNANKKVSMPPVLEAL
jgi:hypothetical protein